MTSSTSTANPPGQRTVRLEELESATIRLAGDSGDGMQLAGTQFTNTSAILGNDISTLPDFPAEIRAPTGTLAGVSGFQIHFSSCDIHTPGDSLNALVAMNPAALKTNIKAGYNYGETTETMPVHYRVAKAQIKPGRYRKITGNEALALGLVAASEISKIPLVYASYPITPASDILHQLAEMKRFGVRTLQAEDEIAAIGAAIGASFGGALGVTATSGPGICLKSEAIGLAVMTELPVIVIDVQRGGPSTGLPTKTEQADLLQAMFGRNGECPAVIVAPRSPSDCFHMIIEAARLAVRFMTPVFFLSDGYLANGAEPWLIPNVEELPKIPVKHPSEPNTNGNGEAKFLPYKRDERLVRQWAIPGAPGLEHRVGGLEKEDVTGNVSYDPANHEHMVETRAQKIANIANEIPELKVDGPESGDLLLVGWGGTYG